MSEIGTQLALVAGLLFTAFVGPGVAMWVMAYRKRRARAQRRSPIGQHMLRSPG
jgi:hypothetical protein